MKDAIAANMMAVRGRVAEACERYDRDTDDITIIAISKTHPPQSIRTAVAAGLTDIGESRVQEAEPKILELGHICRYHSVDSLKLAEEISQRTGEIGRKIECLIEVNASGEAAKHGVPPNMALDLVRSVNQLPNIELIGLMTIGPLTDDEDDIRAAFRRCRELFKQGRDIVGDGFDELSMGMSDDFPLAIAEGATMIRIGTAIFGVRQAD
jgi:uncharacterized pyridoxal phosphate-containing UPF0001 family protein